jgi:molybdopterin molybdotransferase
VRAILSRQVASAQGRRDYIRVRLEPPQSSGTLPTAVPVLGKSGLITTLVMADGLIICPEELEGLSAGQVVEVTLSL